MPAHISFPTELILICLEILIRDSSHHPPHNLLLINKTCRRYLLPRIFRTIHLFEWRQFRAFACEDRTFVGQYLRHLKIQGSVVWPIKKLRTLTASACHLTSVTLHNVLDRSIAQDYVDFFAELPAPHSIQAICITASPKIACAEVVATFSRFPNLRVLHIDGYDDDDDALISLAYNSASLRGLLLTNATLEPDTLVEVIAPLAPTLEYLSLDGTFVAVEALKELAPLLTSLRVLFLGQCGDFSTGDLERFVLDNATCNLWGPVEVYVGESSKECAPRLAEAMGEMCRVVVGKGFDSEDVKRKLIIV